MNIKFFISIIAAIALLVSVFATAQIDVADEASVFRVNHVSHNDYSIVINDIRYIMPIFLKTYTFHAKTRKKKEVNRYALGKDQVVFFQKFVKNGQAYISEITIYKE